MIGIEAAFSGVVARDAEQKVSKTGKSYVRFGVGVGFGDATEWVNVTVFSDPLIKVAAALTKGAKIYIESTLRIDRWTAHDGAPKVGFSGVAFRIELLNQIGKRRPRQEKPKPFANWNGASAPRSSVSNDAAAAALPFADEIPF
jgi:single-stranded DNA-binding protein